MSKASDKREQRMSRRGFLKTSGSVAATVTGAAVAGCAINQGNLKSTQTQASQEQAKSDDAAATTPAQTDSKPNIQRYRTLGRTGFQISDISIGGYVTDANVNRYAYDRGINHFDTAEGYGNGASESHLGEVMKHMDRKKIFIATKLVLKEEDTEQTLLDRYGKCLERMKTDYADALYMHAIDQVDTLSNKAFHAATTKLKADGKLRYIGVSCHGPRKPDKDSLEKVLLAAVEDGRFDVMLMTYNFMQADVGNKVLAACKEKNIGTTAMKVGAGRLEIPPFDPDNPIEEYAKALKRMQGRGMSREDAIKRIQQYLEHSKQEQAKNKPLIEPFMQQHGIKTQDDLDHACIQWAMKNPAMHTVVVSMPEFDKIDKILPLSGTELSAAGEIFLREYQAMFGHEYCRHACTDCIGECPHGLPVSTVMRYSYYFQKQHREKYAMQKYAELGDKNGLLCFECSAPCKKACPHGVSIQASLIRAHEMLTIA